MMTQCEQVSERVALGESLGELTEHVASCERCARTVALPGALGSTHHAVDPGLGFSARMTVGAQQRIAVRHRRRVAVGLAATVAAGAMGVFFVARHPDVSTQTANPQQPAAALKDDAPEPLDDQDLSALANLADVEHNVHVTANWRDIEKPLRKYRDLMEMPDDSSGAGVTP